MPPGIKKVFQSTTDFSMEVVRTQVFEAADLPNVVKVRDGYKLQSLLAYLKQPAPPAAPTVAWPSMGKDTVKYRHDAFDAIDKLGNKLFVETRFFDYLDFALQFAPAGPEEEAIRARLARIGIGSGSKFAFKDLSVEHGATILPGVRERTRKVDEKFAGICRP